MLDQMRVHERKHDYNSFVIYQERRLLTLHGWNAQNLKCCTLQGAKVGFCQILDNNLYLSQKGSAEVIVTTSHGAITNYERYLDFEELLGSARSSFQFHTRFRSQIQQFVEKFDIAVPKDVLSISNFTESILERRQRTLDFEVQLSISQVRVWDDILLVAQLD